VLIHPQKLIKYGLSFKAVMEALAANNRQVGGQYVNLGQEQYLVRGLGLVANTTDIGNIVVAEREGVPIHVREVAEVKEGPALRFGAVTRDGKEVTLGIALARINENAKNVVDAVKQKLKLAQQALPAGVTLNPGLRPHRYRRQGDQDRHGALVEGSILVAIVLFLFLGEIRSALVVIVTLPLAMLIAFLLMQHFGLSANLMSLAGLAIGIGMMVDGAVVMVENAFRLLSHQAGKTVNRTHIILEAAREVINPIAFAILIIIVVFLPLFSLTGLEGKLFKPMALTITFAMVGSLILTLTLVPVLAALILKPMEEKDTFLVRWVKAAYLPLLDRALENKKQVIGGAPARCSSAALATFPLPRQGIHAHAAGAGAIMFRVTGIPSTSLEESVRVSQKIDAVLKKEFPQTQVGAGHHRPRREGRDHRRQLHGGPGGREAARRMAGEDVHARTVRPDEGDAWKSEIPTVVLGNTQPIQMRVEELISGVRATLALKLYGPDLATLDRLAAEIRKPVRQGAGGRRPLAGGQQGQAADRGQGQSGGGGAFRHQRRRDSRSGAGRHRRQGRQHPARRRAPLRHPGRLDPAFRDSLQAISDIPMRTQTGALVPLSRVATVEMDEGYTFVRREQLQPLCGAATGREGPRRGWLRQGGRGAAKSRRN
jgi:cobalt-zinc-cadmium resistance protein CzcA